MKLPSPIPVATLAQQIGAELSGDAQQLIYGVNEIHKVEAGDLTFVDHPKYLQRALRSAATIIILNMPAECPLGKTLLHHPNPFSAYNELILTHRPHRSLNTLIDPTAQIHPTAVIEPNVVIGPEATIGADSYIQSNVYIGEHCHIGQKVLIQAGAIIGTDAFYFQRKKEGGFQKWRSGGRVIIEDEVDIGAGCTINRGVSGDTVIGKGSKLDCQVHVGHGAVIGENCLIAGQVGIGGKTILEERVVVYGQVGIAQSIRIGKGAVIAAKSGVSKSLEGGKTYFGIPAEELREHHRKLAKWRRMLRADQ